MLQFVTNIIRTTADTISCNIKLALVGFLPQACLVPETKYGPALSGSFIGMCPLFSWLGLNRWTGLDTKLKLKPCYKLKLYSA